MKTISNRPNNNGRPWPTREQIAVAAFHLHVENGSQHGHDLDDWLRAESLLMQKAMEIHSEQTSGPQRIPVDTDLETAPRKTSGISDYVLDGDGSAGRVEIRKKKTSEQNGAGSRASQWTSRRSSSAKSAA